MHKLIRIASGAFVELVVVPQLTGREPARIRRERARATTEQRKKINDKHSARSMLRRIACNFGAGDIMVTLTYDDNSKPNSWKEAEKRLTNYKRKVRNQMKRHGADFQYISVTEGVNGLHRLHHHMIVKNTFAGARELLLSMWDYGISRGKYITMNADGTPGYGDIAGYLTKEARGDGGIMPVGKRSWTASKGLRREVITRRTVKDRYTVRVPAGAITVEPVTVLRSDWGSVQSCSYMLTGAKSKRKTAGEYPALELDRGYNFQSPGWVENTPSGIFWP